MNPKPGWQTSEWWVTIVTQFLSFMVLLGVITMQDLNTLQGAVGAMVTAVFTVVSSAVVIWKYIQSRMEIKTEVLRQQAMLGKHDPRQGL